MNYEFTALVLISAGFQFKWQKVPAPSHKRRAFPKNSEFRLNLIQQMLHLGYLRWAMCSNGKPSNHRVGQFSISPQVRSTAIFICKHNISDQCHWIFMVTSDNFYVMVCAYVFVCIRGYFTGQLYLVIIRLHISNITRVTCVVIVHYKHIPVKQRDTSCRHELN